MLLWQSQTSASFPPKKRFGSENSVPRAIHWIIIMFHIVTAITGDSYPIIKAITGDSYPIFRPITGTSFNPSTSVHPHVRRQASCWHLQTSAPKKTCNFRGGTSVETSALSSIRGNFINFLEIKTYQKGPPAEIVP